MKKVLFIIAAAAFCGGSIPPFAKVALEVFRPFTLVMIRFFLASICLLPFVYKSRGLNLKSFKNLFWVSVVGSLNPIIFFIALQFTQASVSPLIYAAVPMMTAIYLRVFRKQKVTSSQTLGIVVGFLGVSMIIILPFLAKQHLALQQFSGNILIFAAAIAFMFYGFMSKERQQKLNVSPLVLTFYFAVISFALSIPFAMNEIFNNPINISQIKFIHILSAFEVGIIGTSIFYLIYQYALKLSSELTAGLFTYLQPVATVFFAVLLLGEKITPPFIIGGLMAVVGAQIATGKTSFKYLNAWISKFS